MWKIEPAYPVISKTEKPALGPTDNTLVNFVSCAVD